MNFPSEKWTLSLGIFFFTVQLETIRERCHLIVQVNLCVSCFSSWTSFILVICCSSTLCFSLSSLGQSKPMWKFRYIKTLFISKPIFWLSELKYSDIGYPTCYLKSWGLFVFLIKWSAILIFFYITKVEIEEYYSGTILLASMPPWISSLSHSLTYAHFDTLTTCLVILVKELRKGNGSNYTSSVWFGERNWKEFDVWLGNSKGKQRKARGRIGW